MMALVDELRTAPDRVGWRGNRHSWVGQGRQPGRLSSFRHRAKTVVDDGNPDALRRLAPHIDSVHLLTPALSCIVPRHVPGTWQALWQDVQYRLIIRQDVADAVWLGGMPPHSGARACGRPWYFSCEAAGPDSAGVGSRRWDERVPDHRPRFTDTAVWVQGALELALTDKQGASGMVGP